MFSTGDTIVAIATPPGRGGLGVVRLSGPDAQPIALRLLGRSRPLAARRAEFARLPPAAEGAGDELIVTRFPAPSSYTGEDVVELSAHGSPVVLASIVARAVAAGARQAGPGEFTLRAFLNGRRDLVQAEAVGDLIDAVTPLQARAAFDQISGTLSTEITSVADSLFDLMARLEASLDFPDEGFHFVGAAEVASRLDALGARIDRLLSDAARGRLIRDGALVVITGAPNVGKSSLFNALLNADRAIVAAQPGTTRDVLSEQVALGGHAVTLVDTAGVRESGDAIEREGVARALGSVAAGDLVLVVLDGSRPLSAEDRQVLAAAADRPRLVVINKCDHPLAWDEAEVAGGTGLPALRVAARERQGLDGLVEQIVHRLGGSAECRESPRLTNVRHVRLLDRARHALAAARATVAGDAPGSSEEFVLAELQEAQAALEEVTGRRTSDDVLRHIFERFCIGK